MQFTAEEYYWVSLERMQQAKKLYQNEASYALAMYCAGLAVESLLRAFRWTLDASFEGRHDLSELLRASRLLQVDEELMSRKGASAESIVWSGSVLKAAMNEVIILWHNNLRFASEDRLRTFLKKINRTRGVRGDPLKKNALDLLNAAQRVINHGVALWTSKTR
jgi:HEPN domain-containing protein